MGVDGKPGQVEIDPSQPQAKKDIIDPETGGVIKSIYNPGVGKYDVCVITGPSYTTKRQEAAESMEKVAQANPALWQVAGDLIVKHMDWPGAEELAERLKRSIDPKLLEDQQSPDLLKAQQEMQQLQQENQEMRKMLENVQTSFEQQELKIKAFDAETKRISAVQAGMSPEQIQDIVLGTVHGMLTSGDLVGKVAGISNPPEVINNTPTEQPQSPENFYYKGE
jgi:hypothetical protein